VSYFRELPVEIVADLAAVANQAHYAADAIIFLEDEPAAGLYVVQEGTVKICRVSQAGREHILHLNC
jgi:CRP/FNR family transcriptional regulator